MTFLCQSVLFLRQSLSCYSFVSLEPRVEPWRPTPTATQSAAPLVIPSLMICPQIVPNSASWVLCKTQVWGKLDSFTVCFPHFLSFVSGYLREKYLETIKAVVRPPVPLTAKVFSNCSFQVFYHRGHKYNGRQADTNKPKIAVLANDVRVYDCHPWVSPDTV